MRNWWAGRAFALAALLVATAQPERTGPRLASFLSSADGSEQEYAVYAPSLTSRPANIP